MSTAVASRPSGAIRPSSTSESSSATCSLLRMAVGTDILAVPIEDVREILQVARMTPLPRTPGFIRGVMNLRGAVVPVVDLAARLGRSRTEIGRRSCVVVVEVFSSSDPDNGAHSKATAMGLLVDAVFDVFDRTSAEIEPAPAIGTTVSPTFLRGMTRASGVLIGVLALEHILSTHDLSQLIADHMVH